MAGPNPRSGARDMLLSLAVLLIPIVAIVWFFQTSPDEPPLKPVDWQATVTAARKAAPFRVVAPEQVPTTWRPTLAAWEAKGENTTGAGPNAWNALKLGFLDDQQIFIGLNETDQPLAQVASDLSRQGNADGTKKVGADDWQVWVSTDQRTTVLARTQPDGSTVAVHGDTDADALASFAQTLR